MTFDFNKAYVLEDDSVILRPIEENDFEYLLPFALNEPELWSYSLISGAGYEGMKNYIVNAILSRKQAKEYPFIVFDKQQMKYAGSTRFYDINSGADTVQLGFTWYGKDFQGTGLNKHCKYLLLEFAFGEMGVRRVEFRADNRNERSKAAMKSIGCKEEGILRSNGYCADGSRRDSIVLSILSEEWHQQVRQMLKDKLTPSI
ncbi:MAG: GNAT family N-acetyltransferase [Saprospiraceae bacterium]|nr:GNAT family N-acetyltransferase [Saprospiraceae bacterium]